jgi:hypothetical protein
MAEIPEFKEIKGLPVSFKLLTAIPQSKEKKKDLFFQVDLYQGLALAEQFSKPYSKSIKWSVFTRNE